MTDFADRYDCQVHYQYMFDGKQKKYFPIISNLSLSNTSLDLGEFSSYPAITFHSCNLSNVELVIFRIRDLNFQNCTISSLSLDINQFGGTLGFANCTISTHSIQTTTTPQIIAIIESVVTNLKEPNFKGFDIHTLAIINSSLDYLDLNPLLSQISMTGLILSEITSSIPLKFEIPDTLESLKLKHITIHNIPVFHEDLSLENLHMEEVDIVSYHHDLQNLSKLQYLRSLYIDRTNIQFLPDFNLPDLEEISIGKGIELDTKLLARLKLTGLQIDHL